MTELINQDVVLEIKPALNGYIIERGEYSKKDGFTHYDQSRNICKDWDEVLEFIKYNKF